MNKKTISMLMLLVLLMLAACAPGTDIDVNVPETTVRLTTPGPNPQLNQPDANNRLAGFGQGLWHGLIAPITLITSFLNENAQMYEVHNNGSEYNLGYLIGVALIFIILGVMGGRRRWR